jgi:polar amino acid transport system permease protein
MTDVFRLWADSLPTLLRGLWLSLQVTGASLVLGIPLGLLLALSVQSRRRGVSMSALLVVEVGRGAPLLVLLQFVYFGLPTAGLTLSAFASATVAFAWCTGAYTSEIIRAGLEAVPHGQKEAAEALGFIRSDALRYVILPQGLRVSIPALLGFSILMLQASSLCFAIALPELLSKAYQIGSSTFRYMPLLVLAAALYAAICIPATLVVGVLERRMGRHDKT